MTTSPATEQTPYGGSLNWIPAVCWNSIDLTEETQKTQPIDSPPSDRLGVSTPARAVFDDACSHPEGVHVLSIFPLRDSIEFARLSCVAVTETATPCREPFCTSRGGLIKLLLQVLPDERVMSILGSLENNADAQLTINDADARTIGFLCDIS